MSYSTQATLSVVNRVIDAKTNRINLQTIPVDCKSLVESTGNMISQPSCHISNLKPQCQFSTQMKISDTAQSISFTMKRDINSLKYLFSLRLASPRNMSNSQRFNLMNIDTSFPPQPCFLRLLRNAENIASGHSMAECATIKLSSFCSVRGHQ